MEVKRYTISEAAEILELETHVLRYWEEELNLDIPRNEMGHRYYTEKEIKTFERIKALKDKGLQLRAIKMSLSNTGEKRESHSLDLINNNQINIADPNNDRVRQFKLMIKDLFKDALIEYNKNFKEELKEDLSQDLREEISVQMKTLELVEETKEKERYKRLDEAIREIQTMRKETATTTISKKSKPWYRQVFKR
ncbi:MAG: MerR family transcriptional regulator [Epulopiscium sp.]|nr:MerR family transcriptional regulator [Candidatus Epulonipiscium sp.]